MSCQTCGTVEWRSRLVCNTCGTKLPPKITLPPVNYGKELAKRIAVGALALAVGPALLFLMEYWIGFFFLGLFTLIVGSVVGIMYILYGGLFPEPHRRIWVMAKAPTSTLPASGTPSTGTWMQYGGPAAAAGLAAHTSTQDEREKPDEGD